MRHGEIDRKALEDKDLLRRDHRQIVRQHHERGSRCDHSYDAGNDEAQVILPLKTPPDSARKVTVVFIT
jgi:hypothetical protein